MYGWMDRKKNEGCTRNGLTDQQVKEEMAERKDKIHHKLKAPFGLTVGPPGKRT